MEALRRSEDFLDRTGRAAATGGWEVDLATGVVRWTVETYRLHGVDLDYRPTVEAGVAFYEPDARPLIRAVLDRAMSDGTPWDLELPSTRADGQRIWLRVVGARETAPHGAGRLIGSIQDVTTQVSAREALRHAHERATLATNSGQIGIWDWDIPGETMVWDAWMYRLYGLPPKDEAPAMTAWLGHLHPDDHEAAQRALYDARDGKHPFDTEFRIVHADQSVRYLRATGRVSHAADGRAVRMVGAAWDVTTQRTLMAELASQHELLRVTLHSIGDGVITTDAHGNVAFLNAVAERLTGWPTTAAAGHALTEVFHIINDDTREPADNPVAVCLSDNRTVAHSNHILLIARDGTEFGIQNSAAPIHSEQGEILGAVLVFHDVTEQRHLSEEMSYRACHDMLTGLLNRAEFEVRLRFALHKAQTDRSENVLLFIDLDQFKLVNDACGHAAGDRLLQQVAKLLGESVRASDTLGRLGGDEFAIVLDHCSTTQAAVLAEQICERMDRFRFVHEGQRFRIGASVGLVPLDERWPTTSALLQAADGACYAAKEAGRNRVQIWTETDEGLRTRQGETQLATRLAQALDEDRFLLFAQRIEPLGVGPSAGIHAEVLLRMVERDGTVTSPGAFLPAAERFHLASRIDRWVLSKVIRWMQDLDSLANIEMVCVNLSGQSVGDRAFHAWAADVLLRAGPSIQHRLCLEITETTAVTNLTDAAVFIAEMRALGGTRGPGRFRCRRLFVRLSQGDAGRFPQDRRTVHSQSHVGSAGSGGRALLRRRRSRGRHADRGRVRRSGDDTPEAARDGDRLRPGLFRSSSRADRRSRRRDRSVEPGRRLGSSQRVISRIPR